MNTILTQFAIGASVLLGFSTAALAQWSIGQPGTREAPQGLNRYAYMVMADPFPGMEAEFNDFYQNVHMGDLVQLPGWMARSGSAWCPPSPRARSSRFTGAAI